MCAVRGTKLYGLRIKKDSQIPVSRKASYWNRCLDKTVRWINEKEKDLKGWDKKAKESLAVAVCNGAVYEPKLQIK